MKDMNINIQEAQRTLSKIYSKRATQRHIISGQKAKTKNFESNPQ